MKGLRHVYWQDRKFWLGCIEEYPDYVTQGESLEDLQEHLRDLYVDLSGGHIPAVSNRLEAMPGSLRSGRSNTIGPV